ncbi:LysR family transcriptional regulator [Pseudoalteromonas sp. S4498]|uniref:LysR family transcriptional regulator n=1 Tax=Pseudoalteromonas galatheae TaxID=579562 RepID=A0A8T6YRN1_9GAMM|nr:LysR family transcriptional regulator [Pseudoalteromonas galatheae]NKC19542.1 LysR family transcriptional regulator [Pseudoalteromonas galatheae]
MDKDLVYLLRVFCVVVEQRSFVKASEILGVQSPAVSKAIAKLEHCVGKRLLNRTTRAIELSADGKMMYSKAVEQLHALKNMLDDMKASERIQGRLTITATPAIGELLSESMLIDFQRQYPDLSLSLNLTNEQLNLPSQEIDIALRSSDSLEDSSLTSQRITSCKRVIVASPEYLASNGMTNEPSCLTQHRCLNFTHRKTLNDWAYSDGSCRLSVKTATAFSSNSYAALKSLCVQGGGVSRLFEYQVRSEINSGELQVLFPEYDWGEQVVHAIYHGKSYDSQKVSAFIHFIKRADFAS